MNMLGVGQYLHDGDVGNLACTICNSLRHHGMGKPCGYHIWIAIQVEFMFKKVKNGNPIEIETLKQRKFISEDKVSHCVCSSSALRKGYLPIIRWIDGYSCNLFQYCRMDEIVDFTSQSSIRRHWGGSFEITG